VLCVSGLPAGLSHTGAGAAITHRLKNRVAPTGEGLVVRLAVGSAAPPDFRGVTQTPEVVLSNARLLPTGQSHVTEAVCRWGILPDFTRRPRLSHYLQPQVAFQAWRPQSGVAAAGYRESAAGRSFAQQVIHQPS
jgi:hypothetical protein